MEPKASLLLYGTAWKEDKTARLTETAILSGFTCVDTANYPTAYNEQLTGEGIAAALNSGIRRGDLFVCPRLFLAIPANSMILIP